MRPDDLPGAGAVLVVTDQPAEWGAVVADRNAKGLRTALLVLAGSLDPSDLAKQMAEEVFRDEPWQLFDVRMHSSGMPGDI